MFHYIFQPSIIKVFNLYRTRVMEIGICLKYDFVCHKKAGNECNQFLAIYKPWVRAWRRLATKCFWIHSFLFSLWTYLSLCSAKPNVFLVETKPFTKTSIQDTEGPSQRNGNFCLFFSPKILFQGLTKLWPRSTRWVDSQSMLIYLCIANK